MARDAVILRHMCLNGMGMWACSACDYATKNKRTCIEHIESLHLDFGEDYVCCDCSKTFKTRKALRRHFERYHKEQNRPF